MKNDVTFRGREGFTLIEVLVTLILLAVLAAAVFPIVTQRSGAADPVRGASDLTSIRSGVEAFRLDVRPEFPGDLEDLTYAPATTVEAAVDGTVYGTTLPGQWNGPYLETNGAVSTAAQVTGDVFKTAYGADVQNDLVCVTAAGLPIANQSACTRGTHSVAVKVEGWSLDQFNEIDELVDGTANVSAGRLRYVDADSDANTPSIGVYVLAPFF